MPDVHAIAPYCGYDGARGRKTVGHSFQLLSERGLQGWRGTRGLKHNTSLWRKSKDASVEDRSAVSVNVRASNKLDAPCVLCNEGAQRGRSKPTVFNKQIPGPLTTCPPRQSIF